MKKTLGIICLKQIILFQTLGGDFFMFAGALWFFNLAVSTSTDPSVGTVRWTRGLTCWFGSLCPQMLVPYTYRVSPQIPPWGICGGFFFIYFEGPAILEVTSSGNEFWWQLYHCICLGQNSWHKRRHSASTLLNALWVLALKSAQMAHQFKNCEVSMLT